MKRQSWRPSIPLSVLLLVIVCFSLCNLNFQTQTASAYQGGETSLAPTIEPIATLPSEEPQPTSTNTPEVIVASEFTETATNIPSFTPTIVPESSLSPTSTASLPLPILSGKYIQDEVLVGFKESATDEDILRCLSSSNVIILSSIENLNVMVVQAPFRKAAESIAAISSVCPEVRYVEPNYVASVADTIPTDNYWSLQYGLVNIHAPKGWDYSVGSTAVTIAIIDTGVDLGHADMVNKIVPGYDFVNGDTAPQDDSVISHGTHVAGIAAASSNNGIGISGVSWGAQIMPVKVLDSGGNGSFANVAAGITWAVDHGAQVINLSLGGSDYSKVLEDAVNYAYEKGVVLVAAAGNSASNSILYPAKYPNVIAVGAVDNTNNHAGFSNYGSELDLVAPGVSIYSTVIGGYGYESGTSMAAAFVSGLSAILCGSPAGYSPTGITLTLKSSTLDLGIPGMDNLYGYGLIQMDTAIQSVYVTSTPVSTVDPHKVGNQPFLSVAKSASTLTPLSILSQSQTPSLDKINSQVSTSTLLSPRMPQEQRTTATPELGLSTYQVQRSIFSAAFIMPCLGIVLILLGTWLFFIGCNKQNNHHIKGS